MMVTAEEGRCESSTSGGSWLYDNEGVETAIRNCYECKSPISAATIFKRAPVWHKCMSVDK